MSIPQFNIGDRVIVSAESPYVHNCPEGIKGTVMSVGREPYISKGYQIHGYIQTNPNCIGVVSDTGEWGDGDDGHSLSLPGVKGEYWVDPEHCRRCIELTDEDLEYLFS